MNKLALYFILLLHLLVVLFIVIVPFLNNNYLLFVHSIVVPFIMLHWYFNNNECCLTDVEKTLRKKINGFKPVNEDCFTCRLIHPIYDFKANNVNYTEFIYGSTTILWLVSVGKLYYKFKSGEIKSVWELVLPPSTSY